MSVRSGFEVGNGFLVAHGTVRRSALVLAAFFGFALAVTFEIPLCPTATLFGVPCPGCGLTRGTLRLLHGDLAGAIAFHPLAPLLGPLVAWLVLRAAHGYVRGTRPASPPSARSVRLTTLLGVALLVALLSVWGARFLGAFGGPVPVTSFGREWIERALGARIESLETTNRSLGLRRRAMPAVPHFAIRFWAAVPAAMEIRIAGLVSRPTASRIRQPRNHA